MTNNLSVVVRSSIISLLLLVPLLSGSPVFSQGLEIWEFSNWPVFQYIDENQETFSLVPTGVDIVVREVNVPVQEGSLPLAVDWDLEIAGSLPPLSGAVLDISVKFSNASASDIGEWQLVTSDLEMPRGFSSGVVLLPIPGSILDGSRPYLRSIRFTAHISETFGEGCFPACDVSLDMVRLSGNSPTPTATITPSPSPTPTITPTPTPVGTCRVDYEFADSSNDGFLPVTEIGGPRNHSWFADLWYGDTGVFYSENATYPSGGGLLVAYTRYMLETSLQKDSYDLFARIGQYGDSPSFSAGLFCDGSVLPGFVTSTSATKPLNLSSSGVDASACAGPIFAFIDVQDRSFGTVLGEFRIAQPDCVVGTPTSTITPTPSPSPTPLPDCGPLPTPGPGTPTATTTATPGAGTPTVTPRATCAPTLTPTATGTPTISPTPTATSLTPTSTRTSVPPPGGTLPPPGGGTPGAPAVVPTPAVAFPTVVWSDPWGDAVSPCTVIPSVNFLATNYVCPAYTFPAWPGFTIQVWVYFSYVVQNLIALWGAATCFIGSTFNYTLWFYNGLNVFYHWLSYLWCMMSELLRLLGLLLSRIWNVVTAFLLALSAETAAPTTFLGVSVAVVIQTLSTLLSNVYVGAIVSVIFALISYSMWRSIILNFTAGGAKDE